MSRILTAIDSEGIATASPDIRPVLAALHPLQGNKAIRRAHAAIRKQLAVAAEETGAEKMEVGRVVEAEDNLDITGAIFDIYGPLKKALKALKADRINLRIHSPGGSAFDGSAAYNLLRQDGRPVQTTAMGMAASAASLLFMAGDERVVAPGAVLMIHDVWSCALGNAEEMRQMAEQLDVASDAIAELYAERAGGKVSEWRDRMATDNYIGGDEAVKIGLATSRKLPAAKPKAKPKEDADADGDSDTDSDSDTGTDKQAGPAPHNTSGFWPYAGI